MTVLEIITYPDDALRTVCKSVKDFDNGIKDIVNDMIETMYAYEGTVGLAAPQVNIFYKIALVDVTAKTSKDGLIVLINPKIVEASKKKYVREGCLSIPDYLGDVKRDKKITVKAQNIDGTHFELKAKDFEAVAIQHEIDHLSGILFIDKIDRLKTDLIRRTK